MGSNHLLRPFKLSAAGPDFAAMTAARLSPAASLLRNSKLFALPPSLSLPLTEPSSEPLAFSDTATTPYPLQAALETPTSSLNRGDWGLKRSLPVKTTTSSGTPTIRIQRGIDTPEHVADFESAADHVITLRKFQELNLRVTLPAPKDKKYNERTSAFSPEIDHTICWHGWFRHSTAFVGVNARSQLAMESRQRWAKDSGNAYICQRFAGRKSGDQYQTATGLAFGR